MPLNAMKASKVGYYLYDLNVDTAVIRDALEKQHRIGGLFETNR